MKSSRSRMDLRIVVDEPDTQPKSQTSKDDDAWWLSGYRLPPPGHLGAHSVPVDANCSVNGTTTADLFMTPTQADMTSTPFGSSICHLLSSSDGDFDNSIKPKINIPIIRREQRRRTTLPSIASLISISPPTAKRSADTEHMECRTLKHFKLL